MNHVLHEVQMPTWEGTILSVKQANDIACIRWGFTLVQLVSDIAIFVLKRDVKLQLTN